ncbi:MAG: hypothetical protein DHS20C07_17340 [Methyloligella sp.]|nr:MAG: hypothetical protein DHS20C07_17340 [Methyloligella sp.]
MKIVIAKNELNPLRAEGHGAALCEARCLAPPLGGLFASSAKKIARERKKTKSDIFT